MGTGGFLLAAHDPIAANHPEMDRDAKTFLRDEAFFGTELGRQHRAAGRPAIRRAQAAEHHLAPSPGRSPPR